MTIQEAERLLDETERLAKETKAAAQLVQDTPFWRPFLLQKRARAMRSVRDEMLVAQRRSTAAVRQITG